MWPAPGGDGRLHRPPGRGPRAAAARGGAAGRRLRDRVVLLVLRLGRGGVAVATFVELTRIDWDGQRARVWVNLDRVDTMIGHAEGTQLSFTDSHINVAEFPEQVARAGRLSGLVAPGGR